jgi:two-component system, chemotaxis family, CheB/CheR fusion protein
VNKIFPVVAIGASAGGLEAISKFLENVSSNLNVAYVIIQHLSPSHPSILPHLLEKKTSMPVYQVTDGMGINPNAIYVIPPNAYMSIVDHKLILSPRVRTDGTFHSIDHFLVALAPIYKNNAIAIILSGTASDGTEGVRAIKAEGGITFAQDDTAKFRGMPENATYSGNVDFVLPPEKIAAELEKILKLPYTGLPSLDDISIEEQELRRIQLLLFKTARVDFSNYKQSTISRRILRRMALNKITKLDEYTKVVLNSPAEAQQLFKDLLINVTSFFREPSLYEEFPRTILPMVWKNKKPEENIRIWVPACSSGEEVYTIAICLFEYLSENAIAVPIQIFATDLSASAIEKARKGIYSKLAIENISPTRVKRFFTTIDGHYQIIKSIRDVCIFATHNLLIDPPFSKVDLISCQNVLIYIEPEAQKRILQSFHYALKSNGFLLLGKSESIGKAGDLFETASSEFKLFVKKEFSNLHFDFSRHNNTAIHLTGNNEENLTGSDTHEPDIDKEAEKVLLSRFVPASVTINKDLQVLQFYGSTLNYLHPAAGKASLHLLKMVREELLFDIKALIHQVKKDGIPFKKSGILLKDDNRSREISIEVIPLRSSVQSPTFLIIFKESEPPGESALSDASFPEIEKRSEDTRDQRIKALDLEITVAREQMKVIMEESEANREELQSANEEVLSSNEELQSINEELETSKEELQSSNEELITINEELINRNFELKDEVEYSNAIVQTITEPLIVLNSKMRVRTANKAFYNFFRVQPADTEGNFFYEIGHGQWNIPELRGKLENIVHIDKNFENFELTHDFPGIGKKSFLFSAIRMGGDQDKNIRYLLAIQDITERKKGIEELRYNKEYFRLLVQNAFDIITIFSEDGTIQYQSESVERILGYKPEDRIGKNIFSDSIIHPDDIQKKKDWFKACKDSPAQDVIGEFRLLHKEGTYRIIDAVCINLLDNEYIKGLVANYRDITNQKALERQKEEFIAIASHELKTPVTSIKGYTQIIHNILESHDEKEVLDLSHKLNNQVSRLTKLIENLLDVTKISGGQFHLQLSTFDLNTAANEIIDEIQRSTRIEIVKNLQAAPLITADRERIGQVITNLLSNAIKYSSHTDKIIVQSEFIYEVSVGQPVIRFTIQDFGQGISEQEQLNIFERFIRVQDNNTNSIPGLGLGLYIAAQIIKRHNGTISVKSQIGDGSTFSFIIPLSQK